jgi:hypothetical protein
MEFLQRGSRIIVDKMCENKRTGQPDLVAIKEELNIVSTCQKIYAPVIWGSK